MVVPSIMMSNAIKRNGNLLYKKENNIKGSYIYEIKAPLHKMVALVYEACITITYNLNLTRKNAITSQISTKQSRFASFSNPLVFFITFMRNQGGTCL